MNDAIFTMRGRLTRRDYALTIGALCGGASLLSFAAVSTLLPLTYFTATAFFREESAAFWILLIAGLTLIFLLTAILLPPLAIPATVRRLHDIGHGGWLALPHARRDGHDQARPQLRMAPRGAQARVHSRDNTSYTEMSHAIPM